MSTAARLLADSSLPRSEARRLLAAVLETTVESLIAHPQRPVGAAAEARFAALCMRREQGEPVAYLLGDREFYGRRFAVSTAVLVPRPETELLVEAALARLRDRRAPRLLDLGTGSGCIAVTLVLERPDAHVLATDRCPEALAVARGNALRLGAKVEFVCSDWYENVRDRYDMIVANPPYVAAADPHLQELGHEPRQALVAGADGLEALRPIIAGARLHLNQCGWLVVEHGFDQAPAVRALFAAAGFIDIETLRDLAGIERACVGRSTAEIADP